MEYEKIINLVQNTNIQLSKFRTDRWIDMNHDINGT